MPRKKKPGSAAWADPDDAPELTDTFFDRAEIRHGDQIIRRGRPPLPSRITAVVKGDGLSLSIAAASIVAKVTRDRMMIRLAAEFPGYGWASNMGYGTAEHQTALARLGITPHHRRSFAPIRKILSES